MGLGKINKDITHFIEIGKISDLKSIQDMSSFIESVYEQVCFIIKEKMARKAKIHFDQILEYIDTNCLKHDLSLAVISEKYKVSNSYISKLFKENIGENYYDYVNKKKMQEAKRLIMETDMNLQEISQFVGYVDSKVFRRTFKKYFLISPSDYRKLEKTV